MRDDIILFYASKKELPRQPEQREFCPQKILNPNIMTYDKMYCPMHTNLCLAYVIMLSNQQLRNFFSENI